MTLSRISFGPLMHSTLGFERFLGDVEKMLEPDFKHTHTFPPHNIIRLNENQYMVELAVAGFQKDEIDITITDGVMKIVGQKEEKESNAVYLHHGIAARSFTKTITVADTVEVRGAEFKDGILRIALENIVPEQKKPRKIEIGNLPKFADPQLLRG
jgi:molecular chaperone IbpA